MEEWKQHLRSLYSSFKAQQEQQDFLRRMDLEILSRNRSVESMFEFVALEMCGLIGATHAQVYRLSGDTLRQVLSVPSTDNCRVVDYEESSFSKALSEDSVRVVDSIDEETPNEKPFPDTQSRLVIPFAVNSKMTGVLNFESEAIAAFSDSPTTNFALLVKGQLEVALRDRLESIQNEKLFKIYRAVFEQKLDSSECMDLIANEMLKAFQELDLKPDVQILFEEKDALVIEATTGSESRGTRVSKRKSVCGNVILMNKGWYVCNPQMEEDYQDFLARNGEEKKLSELVVSLRRDGKIYGVLNAESEINDAFKDEHVQMLRQFGEKLSPVLYAIHARVVEGRERRRAILRSIGWAVADLAKNLRHSLENPVFAMEKQVKQLEHPKCTLDMAREIASDMRASLERYAHSLRTIIAEVAELATFSPIDVDDILKKIVERRATPYGYISFTIHGEPLPKVFATPLLRYHISCIVDNSVDAIDAARLADSTLRGGQINIEKSTFTDPTVKKLNEKVRIKIRDTGIGVTKECAERMFEDGFSLKGSTGWGLPAAKHYLDTIGGKIYRNPDVTKGCEMIIECEVYKSEIHGPLEPVVSDEKPVSGGEKEGGI